MPEDERELFDAADDEDGYPWDVDRGLPLDPDDEGDDD